MKGSVLENHLASLSVPNGREIDDDFPDEEIVVVTSFSGAICTLTV